MNITSLLWEKCLDENTSKEERKVVTVVSMSVHDPQASFEKLDADFLFVS